MKLEKKENSFVFHSRRIIIIIADEKERKISSSYNAHCSSNLPI